MCLHVPGVLVTLPRECSCPLLIDATCVLSSTQSFCPAKPLDLCPGGVPSYMRDSAQEDDAPDMFCCQAEPGAPSSTLSQNCPSPFRSRPLYLRQCANTLGK